MAVVTMKSLLESGVHFGHQTRRWDPKMKKFIFAERNGIHIIDLQKTISAIREAYEAVRKSVLDGRAVLFVGTKRQAQQAVEREATRCGMYFVTNRWLGGMLTNFATITKSIQRLKRLEKMEVDGSFENLTKKEVARVLKEKARLERNLGGIKEMRDLPGIVFVIDPKAEAIAVAEAQRVGIPIVAVVDTNCNPDNIKFPIPGNDDAIRAINLISQIIANAVIEAENEVGLEVIETLQEDREVEVEEEEFASLIDKDEYAGASKYEDEASAGEEEASAGEEEEDVEKIAVGASLGSVEETDTSITDKDYSDYEPGEEPKSEEQAPEPTEEGAELEENYED